MLGLSVGLSEEEIAAMANPDSCTSFDETDRLVLHYSEILTRDNRVDDDTYNALAAGFSKDELMELATTVGLSALVNRVHATFLTGLDEDTAAQVGDANACMLRSAG